MKSFLTASLLLTAVSFANAQSEEKESFYKEANGLFSTRPGETKSLQNIKRFGPVGLGIDLLQPAFVMRISHIEEGSPAEATGKLKAGQIIETINGQKLADIDPRIQLGQILAAAEASDGKVTFAIKDEADSVTVQIPVLGAYSETWPLNCPKSERIVRQVADYLKSPDATEGLGGVGMLFLMSTGDEEDLEFVRNWAVNASAHTYPWYIGYGGIPLAECYLRTGDEKILKNIQDWVDNAAKTQHNDAWAGRGSALTTYGSGHLNAAGTHVVTFLMLAKECGADVPDHTFYGALRHFYRYAGRGSNPYGDGRPEVGFVDNGKNGKLAFAMAAAAALTPDGENSVYAGARDVSAMQSFYSTSFMLHGHTGGGIGEIWRSAAMGLLHDKKPKQYRDFMDNRKWHYDLSRRFDGSFGILGGSGYDKEQWGVAYPLTYTIPRKTLRITGAPPTEFSKQFQLPEQPWGTEADNAFLSPEAVPDANGGKQDLSGETLAEDSSKPFLIRLHHSEEVSDELLRQYIHHADSNIRFVAANKIMGINSGYIGWRSAGGVVRKELMMECLQHKDPRVRRSMFAAVSEILKREKRMEILTREVFDLAVKAVKATDESWWVKDAALQVIAQAEADWIVPHLDLLLPYLKHEESWLQNAALAALTPIAADERCYRKALPAIGDLIARNQRISITAGLMPGIREKIRAAGPDVHKLATATLKETFTGFEGKKTSPAGQNLKPTYDFHLEAIASSLADVPGGLDVLYEIARTRFPNEILPYKEFFLKADPSQFGPDLKKAIAPIINDELIPEFVGKNRVNLRKLESGEVQSPRPGGSGDAIDGLVALYERAGQADYNWQMFADLRNAEWSYHSFDPIASEQVAWDQLITRYREVTLPGGLENWFAPDFDPATANWKSGKSPFGNFNGKLPTTPIIKCSSTCVGPGCYGATRVNTLWEDEVLLMHGKFKLPPLKEGHRYRVRVNDGEHVGAGGGHMIYINGKPLIEAKQGGGRGSGGQVKGAFITKEFSGDFENEVTIAAKTFLRFNDKYKVKPTEEIERGKFSLHFEEQKMPPMGDDLALKSASLVSMTSSEWQARQDPENVELQSEDDLFRWDGKFVANPEIIGSWKVHAHIASLDEFNSEKGLNANRAPIKQISFGDDSAVQSNGLFVYSGDTLLDLNRYQALKMMLKDDHLFIEAGGFSTRNKPEWQTPWIVFKRQ